MRGGAGHIEENETDEWRFIYGKDGSKKLVENDLFSFVNSLLDLAGNEEGVQEYHIDIYSNKDKANPDKKYNKTVDITITNMRQKWQDPIKDLLFHETHDWILRLREDHPKTGPKPYFRVPDSKPESAPAKKPTKGTIYGYLGKLEVENTRDSVLRAALLLTGQYPHDEKNPTWNFDLDIPGGQSGKRIAFSMIPANWAFLYSKSVLPLFEKAEPWWVFVRRGGMTSTPLEPVQPMKNLVQISLEGHGTAYWKIPSDQKMLEDCGINQIQPGFVRAMRLLYPEEPRPKENIYVGGSCVGTGVWECATNDLWGQVKKIAKDPTGILEFKVDSRHSDPRGKDQERNPNHTVIRMAGSHYLASVGPGDWAKIIQVIDAMSNKLCGGGRPASFRIWVNAQAREQNGRSSVINYVPTEGAIDGLKTFFGDWPQSDTIWFRPEWNKFEIVDIEVANRTTRWDARADPSLKSFREALKNLWNDPASYTSFSLVELQSGNRGKSKYIVTQKTTEKEWRLYVYDWFHGSRLAVKRNIKTDYSR